jgi:AraC-like DNA-binding protein
MADNIRIGELLIRAGFLSQTDLEEALEIAQTTDQRIGQVLLRSGFLTTQQLQYALSVQEQIRAGSLSVERGIEALKLSAING